MSDSKMELTAEEERQLEEAAKLVRDDFGTPTDIWHPDYGWILRKSEVTEEGKQFALELRKRGVI